MPNRAVIIIVGGLVVLGGATALFYFAQSSEDKAPVAPVETPAPVTPTPTTSPKPTSKPDPTTPRPAPATPTPEPEPLTGTLIIESDVPDTGVFIDRVYAGTAPVTIKDVKPGPHGIRASATGYDGYDETIDVAAGTRTISIKFKEIKLDASIAVVHKHAIGSCSGTLKATPQGLRYETFNKADAFTVSLTGLEIFSVDYLEKNLKVKIKSGKTLNFADPDGQADRLYAFHKEVDAVRQRILSGR